VVYRFWVKGNPKTRHILFQTKKAGKAREIAAYIIKKQYFKELLLK